MPGLAPRYRLPFPAGQSHELTQGNCGEESHTGRFRYAFDFRMPPGTPVVAAQDGTVIVARDDRPEDTDRAGDENLVMIEHPGGEISRYIHLRRDGVRVAEGDRVAAGDTIALSGNSGRSAFPHLHFDVATDCGRDGCRTIPAAFLNAEPPLPAGRGPVTALGPDEGGPAPGGDR
jgi:murein DD-endopeptidase MepM/ murein hydrolase activator NlpD